MKNAYHSKLFPLKTAVLDFNVMLRYKSNTHKELTKLCHGVLVENLISCFLSSLFVIKDKG